MGMPSQRWVTTASIRSVKRPGGVGILAHHLGRQVVDKLVSSARDGNVQIRAEGGLQPGPAFGHGGIHRRLFGHGQVGQQIGLALQKLHSQPALIVGRQDAGQVGHLRREPADFDFDLRAIVEKGVGGKPTPSQPPPGWGRSRIRRRREPGTHDLSPPHPGEG